MDKFTRQYLETALWSSTDNSDDSGGEPLDKNYSVSDIADATRDKMIADCADFQERFGELYTDSEQAGHDFWLSRNGHGAGFFDGDEERKDELQEAAESYGQFDLYVGDDGEIHGTPLDSHGAGEAREGHRVADFSTLPELIKHAQAEGATHTAGHGPETRIYFPRGDGQYEEATVWQKANYWHAQGPGSRVLVKKPPRDAKPMSSHAQRWASEARGPKPVEDPFYIIQPLWSDGTIVGGLGGGGGESFGFDDEDVAIREAGKVLRDPTFEGDYVQVITRDGELVWDSRGENTDEVNETRSGKYSSRQNPEKALINDVFLDGHRIGYLSGPFSDGGGRKDHWQWRLDSVSPDSYPPFGLSPASGRAKTRQAALDALIHADKARIALHGHIRYTDPGKVSEAHSVRDYIAVDKNDRRVAGPFKSRHEADGHVPPGGHVKFTTAHRRGAPSPAPSAYPMFREGHAGSDTWVPPALAREGITPIMLNVLLHGMGEHAGGARVPMPGDSVTYDRAYTALEDGGYIVLKRKTEGLSSFGDYYVLTDRGSDVLNRYRVEMRKIGAPKNKEAGGRARRPKARRAR